MTITQAPVVLQGSSSRFLSIDFGHTDPATNLIFKKKHTIKTTSFVSIFQDLLVFFGHSWRPKVLKCFRALFVVL
jgi:hypothetical protein